MSASTCARGGLASCSNRVLGGVNKLGEGPSNFHVVKFHFASHSGLRCLHHNRTCKALRAPGKRLSLAHASTGPQASKPTGNQTQAAKPKPKLPEAAPVEEDRTPLTFWEKVIAAFEIFFPPTQVQEAPRQRAKQRLRMILVADRCSVSPTSVSQIKKAIVESLSNFVEIEQEDKVDLNITTDPNLGTIYSVSVPVRRVKPEFDIQTEYENKEFYFDSDGEQIRSLDVTFEDLQQEIVVAKDGSSVAAIAQEAKSRRKGPSLPDTQYSGGRGPPTSPT